MPTCAGEREVSLEGQSPQHRAALPVEGTHREAGDKVSYAPPQVVVQDPSVDGQESLNVVDGSGGEVSRVILDVVCRSKLGQRVLLRTGKQVTHRR